MVKRQGFRRDHVGFDRLATGVGVEKHMRFVGDHWRGVLHTRLPAAFTESTGAYADSLDVSLHIREIGGLRRTGARLNARVRYAAALEYGHVDNPDPPAPLTKLLDVARRRDPQNGRKRAE